MDDGEDQRLIGYLSGVISSSRRPPFLSDDHSHPADKEMGRGTRARVVDLPSDGRRGQPMRDQALPRGKPRLSILARSSSFSLVLTNHLPCCRYDPGSMPTWMPTEYTRPTRSCRRWSTGSRITWKKTWSFSRPRSLRYERPVSSACMRASFDDILRIRRLRCVSSITLRSPSFRGMGCVLRTTDQPNQTHCRTGSLDSHNNSLSLSLSLSRL